MPSPLTSRLGASPNESVKAAVVCATTVDIALTGLQIVDGVQTVRNDRVLVKDQTDATQNGIYLANKGSWVRAPDWNRADDIAQGVITLDQNQGVFWQANYTGELQIGFTPFTFSLILKSDPGATRLIELADVNSDTPTDKNVLVADGTDWESRPLTIDDIPGLQDAIDAGSTIGIFSASQAGLTPQSNGLATEFLRGDASFAEIPLVVVIDGGDAGTDFPGGVVGTGGVGDTIVLEDSSFCPGYPFTIVDADTFTIDGFNVANQYSVGKRLRFTDGDTELFGTITAVDWNVLSVGNTTVDVLMDSGSLSGSITDICFVSSTANWVAISQDPFGGDAIFGIHSGTIGGTTYWVAVGDNGKLGYSTDTGINWTMVTTGTTERLHSVAFNPVDEVFLAVGRAGVMLYSSDGTTWTLDTTSIAANPSLNTGTQDLHDVWWNVSDSHWLIRVTDNAAGAALVISNENATPFAFTIRSSGLGSVGAFRPKILKNLIDSNIYVFRNGSTAGLYNGVSDSSVSTVSDEIVDSPIAGIRCSLAADSNVSLIGGITGDIDEFGISGGGQGVDDVTFSSPINAFARSFLGNTIVCVGDNATLGYKIFNDGSASSNTDDWTFVSTGFALTCNIEDVWYDDADQIFIAVADNGQIARSSTGIS